MGSKTKIDWCDSTWSPILGCNHGCNYCYASRIAKRFEGFDVNSENNAATEAWDSIYRGDECIGFEVYRPLTRITKGGDVATAPYPFGFTPTFLRYKLDEPQQWREPKNIFVCSMADLFGAWVPDEWIESVFDACMEAPQHRYFFLTKNPQRYYDLFKRMDESKLVAKDFAKNHQNWWFGTTITKPDQQYFFRRDVNCFLSIEPIQEDFPVDYRNLKDLGINWIIVGAETGSRIGKVKPEQIWIRHIAETTARSRIPLFMKDSLRELMGDMFIQEKP